METFQPIKSIQENLFCSLVGLPDITENCILQIKIKFSVISERPAKTKKIKKKYNVFHHYSQCEGPGGYQELQRNPARI